MSFESLAVHTEKFPSGGGVPQAGWSFPCYDANGNVTEYVDDTGNIAASYRYDAFGNTISQSGPMANEFRFRFSTKYLDPESGLYYYGRRYYSPPYASFLSRDPIAERGGLNLYAFCANDPINKWDYLGMDTNEVIGPDGRSYHYNPNVFLPPPQCGNGDVSGALSAVLQKFKDKFEALEKNKETQRINEICCNIHKPFEFISWDIMDLTMIGYRSATSFSGFHNIVHVGNGENCEWTVQVGGRCFYGGAVNYTLWGYGFKLCSKYNKNATLERAKWKSSFWKNLKYRGALASEAKGFVEYGWNSGSGTLPNSGGCASCIIPTSIPVYFNGKVFFNSLYIQ